MSEPEIKAIAKLKLKPGDTLVVWLPRDRIDKAANVTKAFNAMGFCGVRLIVAEVGMELSVLEPPK